MQRVHVFLMTLVVVSAGCSREAAPEPEGPTGVSVTVATAKVEPLRDVIGAAGAIVPSLGADFTVTSPELAQIKELPKGEGQLVAQGDLLVRFEIPSLTQELAARQIELAEAQSRLGRAKEELAKMQVLFDKGLLPRVQYDNARADVTSAESTVNHATAQVAAVKSQEERTVVRARFAGLIAKVWRAVGDTVAGGTGDPVLRLIDPSRVQVSVLLPLNEVARVTPGMKARVQTAGPAPLDAIVATRTTPADATATTVDVRLNTVVPMALPVDTPVQVEILIDERSTALVIPVAALLRDGTGQFVYVAGDDGKAHKKSVGVGLNTRTTAEIVSGLAAGDRVIISGFADLNDGVDVVVRMPGSGG